MDLNKYVIETLITYGYVLFTGGLCYEKKIIC